MRRPKILGALMGFFILFGCFPILIPGQREPRRSKMEEYLNLTPEQKAKLDEFRKARQEERKTSFEQRSKLRTDLRELMKDPQANEKKIDGLINEMSQLRASQIKSAIKNSLEMKKIFTQEQLEKMKSFRMRMGPGRGMRWGRDGWRGWRMRPHRGFGWGLNPMSRRLWDW